MIRRNNSRELNPEDYLETSEDTDRILDMYRGVKEASEDESIGATNGLSRPAVDVAVEEAAEEQWDDASSDEKVRRTKPVRPPVRPKGRTLTGNRRLSRSWTTRSGCTCGR